MRLLLITDGIFPYQLGGMQKHSSNLAKYLTKYGVRVTLVHCLGEQDVMPRDEAINLALFGNSQESIYEIVTLKFPRKGFLPGHYLLNSYKYSKKVYDVLDFDAYDFVYAKGFVGWYYIQQKRKGRQLPPIGVKFHGYEMFQKAPDFTAKMKHLLLRRAVRYNSTYADFCFSYGGNITDIIARIGVRKEKIIEIPSGIDSEWIRDASGPDKIEGTIQFVFIGRNERRKGIKELIEAITLLKDNGAFKFHFIGPIDDKDRLKQSNVVYHGVITDKAKIISLLDQMDVLICPSYSEGMPNVILEAMSRGLAIIATDVGAISEMVDFTNGIVLQTSSPDEIKKAILQINNIDALASMKKISLVKIKAFDWNKVSPTIIEEINNLIN